MAKKYKLISYRIDKNDETEYLQIKDFITKELGSDLCFIQWNLLRAFFNGMTKTPNEDNTIELKFLRQNIQLNIGCTIHYNRAKARRLPKPQPPVLKVDREFKLPLLLEDWDLLSEKSKQFWLKAMQEKGIIKTKEKRKRKRTRKRARKHTFISSGKWKSIKSFFVKLRSTVHHLLDKLRRLLKR